MYARSANVIELVSAGPSGALGGTFEGMTPSGSHVYFSTAATADAADTDGGQSDIYARDISADTTSFVTAPAAGVATTGFGFHHFEGASDDGATAVFTSSLKLTADDTNNFVDLYVRSAGTTTRASKPASGERTIDSLSFGAVSATGNHVYFSVSDPLTASDTDVFHADVYDFTGSGDPVLMSRPGTGASATNAGAHVVGATPNGASVFFTTNQSLLTADGDSDRDIYRSSGPSADPDLMTVPGAGADTSAAVEWGGATSDGNTVFFMTSQSMGVADGDGTQDVYSGTAGTAASLVSTGGVGDPLETAQEAWFLAASTDGARVFWETPQKMTASDTDANWDIYVRSFGGTTELASVDDTTDTDADALFDAISPDGGYVAFSTTQQMISADTDSDRDVYVRGDFNGSPLTRLESRPAVDATGPSAPATFNAIRVSGTPVVFFETVQRMTSTDSDEVLDLYRRAAGGITPIVEAHVDAPDNSLPAEFAALSADGASTLFSTSQNLVPGDSDSKRDLYIRSGGATTLLLSANSPFPHNLDYQASSPNFGRVIVLTAMPLQSEDTDSQEDLYSVVSGSATLLTPNTANQLTFRGASADATRVVFETNESLNGADGDGSSDLYERVAGQYVLLTPDTSDSPDFEAISTDGAKVVFESDSDLPGGGDDAGASDVFMSNGGTLTHVSPAGTGVLDEPDATAEFRGMSDDAARIIFDGGGSFTADDNDGGDNDLFVHDVGSGTTLVSGPGDGTPGFGLSNGAITPDGSRILFVTAESLLPTDTDVARNDVYQRSSTGLTQISVTALGQPDNQDVDLSGWDDDGSHVFMATAAAMTAADTDGGLQDVYERSGGATVLVSAPGTGSGSDADVFFEGTSSNGSRVFFNTLSRLTSADTDTTQDVYERSGGVTTAISPDFITPSPGVHVQFSDTTADGRTVALESAGRLLAADPDGVLDVYVSQLPAPSPIDTQTETTPTGAGAGTETTPTPTTTTTTPTSTTTSTTTTPIVTPAPKRCRVPRLKGLTRPRARARLVRANCRLGRVTRKRAARRSRGKVIAQRPAAGRRLRARSRVAIVLGR